MEIMPIVSSTQKKLVGLWAVILIAYYLTNVLLAN